MQSAYVYPTVGDRSSPKEWEELGSTDVLQKAIARTALILKSHHPEHIGVERDQAILERFRLVKTGAR